MAPSYHLCRAATRYGRHSLTRSEHRHGPPRRDKATTCCLPSSQRDVHHERRPRGVGGGRLAGWAEGDAAQAWAPTPSPNAPPEDDRCHAQHAGAPPHLDLVAQAQACSATTHSCSTTTPLEVHAVLVLNPCRPPSPDQIWAEPDLSPATTRPALPPSSEGGARPRRYDPRHRGIPARCPDAPPRASIYCFCYYFKLGRVLAI